MNTVSIVPTNEYKVGECKINMIVGRERQIAFDNGDAIEVSSEESTQLKERNATWFKVEGE